MLELDYVRQLITYLVVARNIFRRRRKKSKNDLIFQVYRKEHTTAHNFRRYYYTDEKYRELYFYFRECTVRYPPPPLSPSLLAMNNFLGYYTTFSGAAIYARRP